MSSPRTSLWAIFICFSVSSHIFLYIFIRKSPTNTFEHLQISSGCVFSHSSALELVSPKWPTPPLTCFWSSISFSVWHLYSVFVFACFVQPFEAFLVIWGSNTCWFDLSYKWEIKSNCSQSGQQGSGLTAPLHFDAGDELIAAESQSVTGDHSDVHLEETFTRC